MQIKIRHATPDDVAAMMTIERHTVTAAHWREADYRRIFAGEGTERVALVIEDQAVVGFIVAHAIGSEWEIENVAIAGEARRRGLGSRLVGELLRLARGRRAQSVFLEVRESNAAARALYEKWSFEESGRRPGYYSEPPEDALVYRFTFPQGFANPVEGGGSVW